MRPDPGRARAEVRKRYLLVACTKMLTYNLLGDWSVATFAAVVLPDVSGFVVHDRYQNYDAFPGVLQRHQLRLPVQG